MNFEWMKLSHTMGSILKPVFDEVAFNLLPTIRTAIGDNESALSDFVSTASNGVSDLSKLISGQKSDIEGLFEKGSMMVIGAAAGFALMGPPGLFVGAALGYAVGDSITKGVEEEGPVAGFTWKETYGDRADVYKAGYDVSESFQEEGLSLTTLGLANKAGAVGVVDAIQQLVNGELLWWQKTLAFLRGYLE